MWVVPALLGLAAVGVLFYGTMGSTAVLMPNIDDIDARPDRLGGQGAGTGDESTNLEIAP